MEVPVTKVTKPKEHAVNPESFNMGGRNPANIPSLKKSPSSKPHKKLRVKSKPDVLPALEQLFEEEGKTEMAPVPPPPRQINEQGEIVKQVLQELSKPKREPKLSEMI